MNIFYLHDVPETCARMHNDKHCVKMILESAQMLCTAHRALDGNDKCDNLFMYKQAHLNHPSTKWVRENVYNYKWMFSLFEELCDEYTYRYDKLHSTDLRLRETLRETPLRIPSINQKRTTPPQCMPDEYKSADAIITWVRNLTFVVGRIDQHQHGTQNEKRIWNTSLQTVSRRSNNKRITDQRIRIIRCR
jgi:hypothetical protein